MRYHIFLATLRDWEHDRSEPDQSPKPTSLSLRAIAKVGVTRGQFARRKLGTAT